MSKNRFLLPAEVAEETDRIWRKHAEANGVPEEDIVRTARQIKAALGLPA